MILYYYIGYRTLIATNVIVWKVQLFQYLFYTKYRKFMKAKWQMEKSRWKPEK